MSAWLGVSIDDLRKRGLKVEVYGGLADQKGLPGVVQHPPVVRKNKFGAVKVERHGRVYDSTAEANRADQLILLEKARTIRALGFQPKFALLGANGKPVAAYVADFCYRENGRQVVEDCKSEATLTPTARLKLKLFLAQYPDHELRLVDGNGRPVKFNPRFPKVAA